MLIFPMWLYHLKFETLKPWNFESCISNLFALAPSEFDTFNVDISHITLSTQIWNLETWNLHFKFCFSLLSELDISNVCISNVDISCVSLSRSLLIIKNKMCNFKIQNVPFSNTKNVTILKAKNVSITNAKNGRISNTKKCPFQIRKSGIFKKEKCVISKYEKCVFFKYENAFISNSKMLEVGS